MDLPRIGLGTYRMPFDEALKAVPYALQVGYKLIDTAAVYRNEEAVGQAIRHVPRNQVFITKLKSTIR